MKRNQITVSFVGVFKELQRMIPQLDSEFCRNVFDDPDSTFAANIPDGFIIKHKINPVPAIAITPQKVVIVATDLNLLFNYIESIKAKLPLYDFAAYGINQEIEWLELESDANRWIFDRFIRPELRIKDKKALCNKLNLQFGINESQELFIELEPRNGMSNGLFASINHHNQYAIKGFPSKTKLKDLFTLSEATVDEYLNSLIC